jgi:hypothetical protein
MTALFYKLATLPGIPGGEVRLAGVVAGINLIPDMRVPSPAELVELGRHMLVTRKFHAQLHQHPS